MQIEWDVKKDGALATDTTIKPNRWVQLQYRHLKPTLKASYDKSVTIHSRKSWGARAHRPHSKKSSYEQYKGPLESIYHSIAVHHAGNKGYRTMKEVQDLHMDKKDRADVGYHYGVDLKGKIHQGRPINIKGSHIKKGNTGVIGIVLLADLDEGVFDVDDSITSSMESSLLTLIHYLLGKYPKLQFLGGHKEYNSDRSCPGNLVMDRINSWRSSTGLRKPKPVT